MATEAALPPDDELVEDAIRRQSLSYWRLVSLHRSARQDEAMREVYGRALAAFQAGTGVITKQVLGDHFSIAMTVMPRGRVATSLGGRPLADLYISVVREKFDSETTDLVDRAFVLALRAEELPRSRDRWDAISRLFGVVELTFGVAERAVSGTLTEPFKRQMHAMLDGHENDIGRAAQRGSQLTYFVWMFAAIAALLVISSSSSLALKAAGVADFSAPTYIGACVAGGLGAIVSVMARMAHGSFLLEPEVGTSWIRVLGFVRPFIGAVFGVVSYFALEGRLLGLQLTEGDRRFYTYVVIAFLMGFNERWARDMLVATQSGLGFPESPRSDELPRGGQLVLPRQPVPAPPEDDTQESPRA